MLQHAHAAATAIKPACPQQLTPWPPMAKAIMDNKTIMDIMTSESEIELPGNGQCCEESVESEAELPDHGSDAELPDQCCRADCLAKLKVPELVEQIRHWDAHRAILDREHLNEYAFRLLQAMRQIYPESAAGNFYQFLGIKICRVAFRVQLGMGNNRLDRLISWLKDGHHNAPQDLRHMKASSTGPATRLKNVCMFICMHIYIYIYIYIYINQMLVLYV